MKRFLFVTTGVTALALAPMAAMPAYADVIMNFGQTSGSNTISAIESGGSTTVTASGVAVGITSYGGTNPGTAFLNLSMHSVSGAVVNGSGVISQLYSGTFQVTQNSGGGGNNYLSGTFGGTLSGALGGTALSFSSVGSVAFTSSPVPPGIPASSLLDPTAVAFSFTNVTPAVSETANSIGSFASSVSGNMSSNFVAPPPPPPSVPEPASMAVLGVALVGLGAARRRSRS